MQVLQLASLFSDYVTLDGLNREQLVRRQSRPAPPPAFHRRRARAGGAVSVHEREFVRQRQHAAREHPPEGNARAICGGQVT